ncbi:lytic transglycosylase [Defluviimonas sp. WL0002]|uniref:Lytic transglycosylase n=1 Tax=Albidovulum marisflavi TaxID=2984159 RepID=A0ABT2Z7W8_9RHOB|nr:lytic transglycosylase [Defluviimonas sp. WL0002]MCV2867238.1 lytic transglycosylase [Defluviimonas sp. WL0002]
MSRYLCIALVMLLAACGGGGKAPRNLNDACEITAERPAYLRAMKRTEAKWGVPVAVQMATIYQESKFISNAKTPRKFALGIIPMGRQSSAYGYSQALDGTWDEYRKETGRWGAKRQRIDDATDFIGWYMDQSEQKLGIMKFDAKNQYLAYHEGRNGYSRGSHMRKAWLLRVADDVSSRAQMYHQQLYGCGKL